MVTKFDDVIYLLVGKEDNSWQVITYDVADKAFASSLLELQYRCKYLASVLGRALVLSTSITPPTSLTVLNRVGLGSVLPSHTLLASLDFVLCFVRTHGSEEDSFRFPCISGSL